MTPLSELLQQSAAHAWLFIPSAILLGALHGLEPGHSKTMMAAFIVAVRGTVRQAVLLGLAATVSHTAIVWIVALGGVYLFQGLSPEGIEPYFQFASGLMIVAVALWMLWRIHHEQSHDHHHHDHDHDHDHDHAHDHHDHHDHHHDHAMDHDLEHALDLTDGGYQDAHERQHAEDIRRRFAGRNVTTGQIVMFGLTGGLIPCPGAITVLLLCLQLKRIALGSVLVLCFSIGLALTMVMSGVIAALSVRYAQKTFGGFGTLVRKAPYASGLVILCLGLYVALHAYQTLP
ncbi:nickel/cobalt efflux transporter RcnA [Novosphingobium profundi]|uniref:nickel/cobalt efflux transporter n=1 Tax=Novosphingobium profundi TaxID=1774954 RepID=UPI001BDA7E65|nr:nickel/cobalt efflux transporter [Novosphingobium profundi]MBT0667345.1 nickel/cobalt efflux transporter RcnA [Novosphingobium profundi]